MQSLDDSNIDPNLEKGIPDGELDQNNNEIKYSITKNSSNTSYPNDNQNNLLNEIYTNREIKNNVNTNDDQELAPIQNPNKVFDDDNSLSIVDEDLSIGANPFYVEALEKFEKTKRKKIIIGTIYTYSKFLFVTIIWFLFLIAVCILSVFLWIRSAECNQYETRLSQFKLFEMNAEDLWPKNNDPMGYSYGDSIIDRRNIFKELKNIQLNLNNIYLKQRWNKNLEYLKFLEGRNFCSGIATKLYNVLGGPWDETSGEVLFKEFGGVLTIPDVKPPGGGLYPEDITKSEFNNWISNLEENERKMATSFYTTIRRDINGKLYYLPYSEAFKLEINSISASLQTLSELFKNNPPLKDFIQLKASAFLSNSYIESDISWIKTNSSQLIDITIGPYETYEDEIFGYKATFEAFVSVKDEILTMRLIDILKQLQYIEDSLPIDAKFKNPKVGTSSSISVVNLIMNAGDAAFGVQTAAYNLPNDASITKEFGSKRILLKNVQEAKFNHTLVPLIPLVLSPEQHMFVNFDAFFTQVMAHEIMHGLGPHTVYNGNLTVREALKEYYSPLEEAKADISGLFMLLKLIDSGKMNFVFNFSPELKKQYGMTYNEKLRRSLFVTYLVSTFRSARFGSEQAHGRAVSMAFKYLSKYGGIVSTYHEDHYIHSIQFSFIEIGISNFIHDIMTIQANGDYEGARAFFREYSPKSEPMRLSLERIKSEGTIPTDIRPITIFNK